MKKAIMLCASVLLAGALALGAAGVWRKTMIRIDENVTHQTLESFGTSAAWWSQYMGEWDMPWGEGGRSAREQIALWLFDREEGIGLTNYRYNLGAGSADSGNGDYSDVHRRAQSFEVAPGVYDWSKDAGAQWFVQQAAKLGTEEVVLFFNSPLERLTRNGWAHLTPGGSKNNIDPDNYAQWAVYACDAAEHFIANGVPVKFISPINEPQWDWTGGQEGCHYEPEEIAQVYKAFLEEMRRRPALDSVKLSGPESGEWGGSKTREYVSALMEDPELREHLEAIDCHSYWTDTKAKVSFHKWMDQHYPDVKIRMSEWCEMVSGTDLTMDSAIHLAQCVAEDLTVLDAVHWATWVGVSPGGYRDGVIHAVPSGDDVILTPLKRLWAYGNFTRYIRPGFTRVETTGGEDLGAVAFTGEEDGRRKLVLVLINEKEKAREIALQGDFGRYRSVTVHETSPSRDLEQVARESKLTQWTLAPLSVTTIVYSE